MSFSDAPFFHKTQSDLGIVFGAALSVAIALAVQEHREAFTFINLAAMFLGLAGIVLSVNWSAAAFADSDKSGLIEAGTLGAASVLTAVGSNYGKPLDYDLISAIFLAWLVYVFAFAFGVRRARNRIGSTDD